MPGYFSYIGELDCPGFFWNEIPEDKGRTGNTPDRIIPKGFSLGLGFGPGVVEHWKKKACLEGKQLDWGAWGIKVRKSDLEMIWKDQKDTTAQMEWLKYWDEIQALRDDETYVLIVAENP